MCINPGIWWIGSKMIRRHAAAEILKNCPLVPGPGQGRGVVDGCFSRGWFLGDVISLAWQVRT